MDTTPLKDAYGAFLDAAATVARAGGRGAAPGPASGTPRRSWRTSR